MKKASASERSVMAGLPGNRSPGFLFHFDDQLGLLAPRRAWLQNHERLEVRQ